MSLPKTNLYSIYKLKNYSISKANFSLYQIEGNINNIITKLNKNKGYHLRINPDKPSIIFIDLDHVSTTDIFNEFLYVLCVDFEIELNNISYTESKDDKNLFSYHITIPSIKIEKAIYLKDVFNEKCYSNYREYIDYSIYSEKWFRLPNQTNEIKPRSHIIKQGEMKHFIFECLDNVKEQWLCDQYKNKILEKTMKDETKKVIQQVQPLTTMNNDEVITKLNLLSIERVNKYNTWLKLGCLCYSLNAGYEIFLNLSRKSVHYQNDEYILNKWQTIKYKKYSIKTLNAWAKFDNPKEYNRLFKEQNNKLLVKPLLINYRYLLDANINDNLLVTKTNDFFSDENIKSLNICSPYNTGKTQYIKNVLDKFQPERILWVSYRISLTNDIKYNFESYGFQTYLTGNYRADKLIVQLESLHKLDYNSEFIDEGNGVPSYDLVIIDEVESILSQFNSPTFKMESREIFVYLN